VATDDDSRAVCLSHVLWVISDENADPPISMAVSDSCEVLLSGTISV